MKLVLISAMLSSFIALGVGVYHIVETHPNEEYFREKAFGSNSRVSRKIWHSYEEVSDVQGVVVGVSGILGLILCFFGYYKEKQKFYFLGILGSLIGLLIVLSTKTHMFS